MLLLNRMRANRAVSDLKCIFIGDPNMNEGRSFLEKVDVFLPGQGETLTQAPAYHWERAVEVVGRIYRSTRDPNTMLVNLWRD